MSFFDQLAGNGWIRQGINEGKSLEEMETKWQSELEGFLEIRKRYLLY
ncbi:exo-beta-N-acetylmuramidase NamZ domain-containing protein [Ectobacillus panaciterrae]|nr:exo-beta-N-acetylmuramidase NamZ domain-containing protein [Ectobacillus panaciterrae]